MRVLLAALVLWFAPVSFQNEDGDTSVHAERGGTCPGGKCPPKRPRPKR
jgi:hypothetical protein